MTVSLDYRPDLVEPAARGLIGAIDLGDGGSEKQRQVLRAIVERVWERPDLDIDALAPMSPAEIDAVFDSPIARGRFQRFAILLEFCRYPFSVEQAELMDTYHAALGGADDDEGLRLARVFIEEGVAKAIEDLQRVSKMSIVDLAEASIADRFSEVDMQAPELAAELRRFVELPEGTLGREYYEFYMRHSFELPGEGNGSPAFFVRHDMGHIIAGYGPTAPEELALAAFHCGMKDNDSNWNFLVVALAALELGLYSSENFEGKEGILDREGALDLMVDGFIRGSQCLDDFSEMDHLGQADVPVAEIRERHGVIPRRV